MQSRSVAIQCMLFANTALDPEPANSLSHGDCSDRLFDLARSGVAPLLPIERKINHLTHSKLCPFFSEYRPCFTAVSV